MSSSSGSGGAAAATRTVTLVSAAREARVSVDVARINECSILHSEMSFDEPIPLPNINAPCLSLLAGYLNGKSSAPEFCETLGITDLINTITMSDYMGMEELNTRACERLADLINACTTPEQVRQLLDLPDDLTEEQTNAILQENEWLAKLEGIQMMHGV